MTSYQQHAARARNRLETAEQWHGEDEGLNVPDVDIALRTAQTEATLALAAATNELAQAQFAQNEQSRAGKPATPKLQIVPDFTEHSDRARYVTEQVAQWVTNDGDYYDRARKYAAGDQLGLAEYLTRALKWSDEPSAAWYAGQELAPNDYARIHWDDVAKQLLDD